MDLFLETPQQRADRILRQQERMIEMGANAGGVFAGSGTTGAGEAANGEYGLFGEMGPAPAPARQGEKDPKDHSLGQETYRRELDYDRARHRKRRLLGKLKVLVTALLVPLGLVAIFLVSYALTCILNGATPEEVVQHLAALGQRLNGVWTTLLYQLSGSVDGH